MAVDGVQISAAPPTGAAAVVVVHTLGVLQGFVDLTASLNATHIRRESEAVPQPLLVVASASGPYAAGSSSTAVVPVAVGTLNLLYIPVLRSNSSAARAAAVGNYSWFGQQLPKQGWPWASGLTADPQLVASFHLISVSSAIGSTGYRASGYWSSSKGCYVMGFRAPSSGVFHGQLNLTHPGPGSSKEVGQCAKYS